MSTWAIYLRPRGSVSGWLSSDTIFGAICWAIRQIYDENEVSRWLNDALSEPLKLAVSSTFPFVDLDNKPFHFFPKPMSLNPNAQTVVSLAGNDRKSLLKVMSAAKRLSKLSYMSESLFTQTLQGSLTAEALLKGFLDESFLAVGSCLVTRSESENLPINELGGKAFWVSADIQHTVVDRVLTSAAEGLLYFDTDHFFRRNAGLFFFLRCPEGFPIEPIVRFWQHSSLGGNRSVGKGHFDVSVKPADDLLNQLQPESGNAVVLLSLCIPKLGEFDPAKSFYRIVSKRPKFESAYGQPKRVYKGMLRFVSEGSVLVPKLSKDAYGQLVKVGDQTDFDGISHPVYHNGIGFALRMVMQ